MKKRQARTRACPKARRLGETAGCSQLYDEPVTPAVHHRQPAQGLRDRRGWGAKSLRLLPRRPQGTRRTLFREIVSSFFSTAAKSA